MTHNFTANEWQQIAGGFKLEVPFNSTTDNRPIIQVYSVENGNAMLTGTAIVLNDKFISLISPQKTFDGFVVIK